MSRYFQRTHFWGKVRDTFALFGTGTTIGLEAAHVSGFWVYVVSGSTLIGAGIAIWMDDHNKDGIADIFQDLEKLNKDVDA
jgi:hypothetical protein